MINKRTTSNHKRIRRRRRLRCQYFSFSITLLLVGIIIIIYYYAFKKIEEGRSRERIMMEKSTALRQRDGDKSSTNSNIVILTLKLNESNLLDIPLILDGDKAPDATKYVTELAASSTSSYSNCKLYRGEPVPTYWGSTQYPDRYFNGGRWGPPYALVQGQLLFDDNNKNNNDIIIPKGESFRPIIERGMIAWAGGKGGSHFFIALANHPEWNHDHSVFGKVRDETSMKHLDTLVDGTTRSLRTTKPKVPPIVTNFIHPIPISIRLAS